MRYFWVILLWANLAVAQESIVADLSQSRVSITANFDGSDIFIYGAVKRETPIPSDAPLEVVIAVAGPLEPVTVRRKERQLGIWVNVDSLDVDAAPSYYAVAASGPLNEVLSEVEDLRYKVSIERMIRSVGAPADIAEPELFSDAIKRIRQANALYSQNPGRVKLTDSTLFQAGFSLPANLVEGDYTARIFLTRDGSVIDQFETIIQVRKVGLERWIYNLAHQQPLLYGLLSLFIAISAGWLASGAFRLLRV